jgi:hypothetical protein
MQTIELNFIDTHRHMLQQQKCLFNPSIANATNIVVRKSKFCFCHGTTPPKPNNWRTADDFAFLCRLFAQNTTATTGHGDPPACWQKLKKYTFMSLYSKWTRPFMLIL